MFRIMKRPPGEVATIILAGGKGTRLHPLTLHHSKPAVSYGGRYRLIDVAISNALNANFRQIFVIAQYLSDELKRHIHQTYQFDAFNPGFVDVLTPQETETGEQAWFAGTADAVRKNLPTLLRSNAEYFLILSGDQLYAMDLNGLVSYAKEKKADLTIASLPVHKAEAKRMGLLKIDTNGKVIDFCEKPQEEKRLSEFALEAPFFERWEIAAQKESQYLGSMGIYVFKKEALISLLEQDERNDFGYHIISTSVKKNKTFGFVYRGYWEDIGTVSSYYEANLMLTRQGAEEKLNTYDEQNPIYTQRTFLPGPKIQQTKIVHSIICEGSLIEAEEISNSIIGLRTKVGKGTIIRNTVMMGNHFYMPPTRPEETALAEYGVGENCLIEKAIIDEHVSIGNRVKLTNEKNLQTHDGKGIFIRDGIIIVTAGTHLPDDFTL